MANKITTLYITNTNIRLMETSGKRISKLADAPLEMNLSETDAEVKEAEIAAKIRQLFEANKVNTKKIIVGMSGLHCLSRPAILPNLPRAMQEEAVIREARRVLPVPLEQLYISWQIIATTEDKMQIFIIAIPRQIADTLLSILHRVGLKPYLMDIKPLALARLAREATAIVVDIQSEEFDIVIVADGIPQPIRTVPFPVETLSLTEKLILVKDELSRTLQFYNSNNPEKTIDSNVTMYVSGELLDEPELLGSMAAEFGYNIVPLSSPLKCPKQLDVTHHLINIGLALKELPKEAGPLLPNLNTLPGTLQAKPLSWNRLIPLPAAAVAIGLIIILAMNVQDAGANIESIKSELDSVNFILDQRQSQKKELEQSIADLESQLASHEANRESIIKALDSLVTDGDKINGDFEAAVNNMVNGLILTNISHSGSTMDMNGNAPSEVEVFQYARNMDASDRFSEITITSITRVGSKAQEVVEEGEAAEGEAEATEGEGEVIEGEIEEPETEGWELVGEGEEVEFEVGSVNFHMVLKLKGAE